MHVILYKRHKQSCPHRDDKNYRRCRCSVWMEYNVNGVQTRKSVKTFSWDTAGEKARAIEQAHLDAELGRGPAPAEAKTVEQAIALFRDSKRGEDLSPNTLYKHKLTLSRLQDFCDKEGVFFVKDITLAHLTTWQGKLAFQIPACKTELARTHQGIFQILYGCRIHGG